MASSGNFCTLNTLVGVGYSSGRVNTGDMSLGNLKYEDSGSTGDAFVANMAMTGKTYCEVRIDSIGNYGGVIGLRSTGAYAQTYDSVTFQTNYSSGLLYHYKGTSDQSASGNVGGTVSAGNIVMFAYDPATYKWWVGVNGTWRNSGDPANGSGEIFTGSATMFENMDVTWGGWVGDVNGLDTTWNFGQDSTFGGVETAGGNADDNGFGDFKYSPPTGFLALCTGNLSVSDDIDPAQTDSNFPAKNFNVVLFTGNGSTNAVTGLGFKPDLIWGFTRDGAQDKRMIDSTRGGSSRLYSNNSNTADTSQTAISAFGTDGFTANGGYFNNDNTKACGAWCWRANGGTTSTNSDGSADTTIQANTAAGFSIFTFANSSGSKTLGHGLGKAPSMYVIRGIGEGTSWGVYHKSLGATKYVRWNSTNGSASSTAYFNDTEPTSSVLSVGSTLTGSSLLCYAWAEIEGYSKFTTYLGNGNTDGPFIYLGFRPRMIMLKRYDRNGDYWYCIDTARNTSNGPGVKLTSPDNDITESNHGTSNVIDFLSNGFKMRTSGSGLNGSGGTWLVAAWADVPFKYNNTF